MLFRYTLTDTHKYRTLICTYLVTGSVDYLCIFTLYEGGFNYTTVYQSAAGNETNPYIPFSCMVSVDLNFRLLDLFRLANLLKHS